MKKLQVGEITGSEVLARDIVIGVDTVLMVAGTVIKREYAQKLKALDIKYVYVTETESRDICCEEIVLEEAIEEKIKIQCQEQVRETIELYASYGIEQLTPIISIADSIISDVLQQPEVIYNISGIRQSDENIFAHSLNVCALAVLIAIRMKFSADKIKEIAIGCLLHDIGLTYFADPSNIQEYDDNGQENEEYKKHVIYGYTIVNKEPWITPLSKNIVFSHHENLDGSGYPLGIVGKKIKKAVRIVAVCDIFDRLVYGATGKKCKVVEAIDYIISQADIKYDLSVVKVFLDTVAAYPNGSVVTTNRGQRAVVVRQNRKCPTRPVLRIIKSEQGISFVDDEEIDLTKDLTLFIVDSEL